MQFAWIFKILGVISGVNVKKVLVSIIKYWREILIVVFGLTFWYQNYAETRFIFGSQTIPALEKELSESQNNLKVCGDGNARLSAAIEKNNTKIEEYKKITKELEASVVVLGDKLKDERKKTNAAVEDILKEPVPQSCEKAIDYLREAGKELKW